MEKSLRDAWIDDLRSGKYEQEQGKLYDGGNGYCCLGVLYHQTCPRLGFNTPHSVLNDEEFSRAGCEVLGLPVEYMRTLVRMNDGETEDGLSYTFAEIADDIENNL